MSNVNITGVDQSIPVFPKTIGEYSFVEEILTDKYPKPYSYGIYQSKTGKKAFAKMWSGSKKERRYTFLLNELNTYKALWSIFTDSPSVKKKYTNLPIPRLLGEKKSDETLVILVEYIEGELLAYKSDEMKIAVYKDMLSFLDTVNRFLRPKYKATLLQRNSIYWIMILPLVTLQAVVKHPSAFLLILRANIQILANLPLLLSQKETSFVHRDLANWNVKVGKKQSYLYDFQLSCISHPLLEYAVTTLKLWENKVFANKFYTGIVSPKLENKNAINIFRSLSLCLAIYDLGLSDGGSSVIALDYMRFNLDSKQFLKKGNMKNTLLNKLIWHLDLLKNATKDYLYSYTYSSHAKPRIAAFDPKSKAYGEFLEKKIKTHVPTATVKFIGSASLGIMGEKDVDILIGSSTPHMAKTIRKLSEILGDPIKIRSAVVEWKYPNNDLSIEVSLFDITHPLYMRKITTYNLLAQDKNMQRKYELLKKESQGISMRKYDQKKIYFFTKLRNEWKIA